MLTAERCFLFRLAETPPLDLEDCAFLLTAFLAGRRRLAVVASTGAPSMKFSIFVGMEYVVIDKNGSNSKIKSID